MTSLRECVRLSQTSRCSFSSTPDQAHRERAREREGEGERETDRRTQTQRQTDRTDRPTDRYDTDRHDRRTVAEHHGLGRDVVLRCACAGDPQAVARRGPAADVGRVDEHVHAVARPLPFAHDADTGAFHNVQVGAGLFPRAPQHVVLSPRYHGDLPIFTPGRFVAQRDIVSVAPEQRDQAGRETQYQSRCGGGCRCGCGCGCGC